MMNDEVNEEELTQEELLATAREGLEGAHGAEGPEEGDAEGVDGDTSLAVISSCAINKKRKLSPQPDGSDTDYSQGVTRSRTLSHSEGGVGVAEGDKEREVEVEVENGEEREESGPTGLWVPSPAPSSPGPIGGSSSASAGMEEVASSASTSTNTSWSTNSGPGSGPPIGPGSGPGHLDKWLTTFHSWTHSERLFALDSLVSSEICDIQQIRYLLSLIEPQLQRDFISLLPKELALYVLSFLEPKDLLRAAQTCRYWRILCEDNLLWREKCREEGLLDDNETIADLFRKRIRSRSGYHSKRSVSPLPSPSTSVTNLVCGSSSLAHFVRSEYKLAYLRQKAIEHNWRYGQFPNESETATPVKKGRPMKEILHLKGHDDHVITCLQFNPTSNLIVSGSDDNTLKVWSSISGKCLRTLTGHTGGVWSSQLSPGNIVISGSTDRTLKVWNAISGECLHTLYGHTSTVRCMALHGEQVVSGSRDATLRVWDITSGDCCHVLVGHVAAVRCVQFNGRMVVSGAYDYLVKVWDVNTENCLHTLEGHTNRVYSLQFDGENIVSGSLDTSIRVWSASRGSLKHTLIGHQSLTSGMQLRASVLVSGNADSTVKVWDINTGQCLQTLAGPNKHQSAVTCLQFNARFVITSSDDGTVKLWDLRTGEFIRNLVSLSSGGSGGVVWRIRASNTRLVCAVGSRNGTEETKLLVLDFDPESELEEQPLEQLQGHDLLDSPLQCDF